MVRFTLWLIATTALLKTSSAQIPGLTCENYNCESGHVCVLRFFGRSCAVKEGLPCEFFDYCEGGYYCRTKKVCAGGLGGIPMGGDCNGGGCRAGFHCHKIQKKCFPISYSKLCKENSECERGCPNAKGCSCSNGYCFPNS